MSLLPLLELEPPADDFRADVLVGLAATPKSIAPKYFYDTLGSRLFDAITELPEYYPTRTELGILAASAGDMATALGPGCLLIEPGSGSSVKVRCLLDHLEDPAGYVPIEIAREHLELTAAQLSASYPQLPIQPVHADFSLRFELPAWPRPVRRRVVYYPGSTIGNFEPDAALQFLGRMARLAGPGGAILIGVDRLKDPTVLQLAYDDPVGVTAAFNRNLLARINRELDADFDVGAFVHRAVWNPAALRIEMWLVASRAMDVTVAGERFHFAEGEGLETEHSHKYSCEGFAELATATGLKLTQQWSDPQEWFSVLLLESA